MMNHMIYNSIFSLLNLQEKTKRQRLAEGIIKVACNTHTHIHTFFPAAVFLYERENTVVVVVVVVVVHVVVVVAAAYSLRAYM